VFSKKKQSFILLENKHFGFLKKQKSRALLQKTGSKALLFSASEEYCTHNSDVNSVNEL